MQIFFLQIFFYRLSCFCYVYDLIYFCQYYWSVVYLFGDLLFQLLLYRWFDEEVVVFSDLFGQWLFLQEYDRENEGIEEYDGYLYEKDKLDNDNVQGFGVLYMVFDYVRLQQYYLM